MDEQLLKLIRCPLTHDALTLADARLLEQVNQAVAAQTARTRGGGRLVAAIEQGLVNASRDWLYPVRSEIPSLVPDEAVDLRSVFESNVDRETAESADDE